MNIAVLSGKGGTGKTFVSTNLAYVMDANYADLDVEAPNGYIFLKADNIKKIDSMLGFPIIDEHKCKNCGKCEDACVFNALAVLTNEVKVFEKLCHACNTCKIVCPEGAIDMGSRKIGEVTFGELENSMFYQGKLDISEPMAVPIIKQVTAMLDTKKLNILDCPPGTSCSVVNSLKVADYAILVTEPTPFGLHDFTIAHKVAKNFKVPCFAIINRSTNNDEVVEKYINDEKIPLLGKIPFNQDIAKVYSKGDLVVKEDAGAKNLFDHLKEKLLEVIEWK